MPYQIPDPVDIPRLQQLLDTLQAEIDERERATAALASQNAALTGELQRRLTESESFNRVLVSLLQKTVLDQVLDIVCTEAQGLIGATGSAVLLLTDQAWLEVKHRLGTPLAAVDPVPVDGSLAGQVVRQGTPVVLNDPAHFERTQIYQWPADLSALLAVAARQWRGHRRAGRREQGGWLHCGGCPCHVDVRQPGRDGYRARPAPTAGRAIGGVGGTATAGA